MAKAATASKVRAKEATMAKAALAAKEATMAKAATKANDATAATAATAGRAGTAEMAATVTTVPAVGWNDGYSNSCSDGQRRL